MHECSLSEANLVFPLLLCQQPVAFEVCMSPDDRVEPRTLPPPRLKVFIHCLMHVYDMVVSHSSH